MNIQQLVKPNNRWMVGLTAAGVLLTGGIAYQAIEQFRQANKLPESSEVSTVQPITALGRLEP